MIPHFAVISADNTAALQIKLNAWLDELTMVKNQEGRLTGQRLQVQILSVSYQVIPETAHSQGMCSACILYQRI